MAGPPVTSAPFACRLDGQPATAVVGPDALDLGTLTIPWVAADRVEVADHTCAVVLADGTRHGLSHLGKRTDEFVAALTAARNRARRAALLQWTGDAPLDSYAGFDPDSGRPLEVVLFPDGLTVESLEAPPQLAPFPLIEGFERAGYAFTVTRRGGLAPVRFGRLGPRTDELVAGVDRARHDLVARTAEAYAGLSDALAGYNAPNGWACGPAEAGSWWGALHAAVAGQERAAELALLESLPGASVRLGLAAQAQATVMPFALVAVNDKVAVESADGEARATFVFRTGDVERLNAALILTSFRRDAIAKPEAELGRWALAVRTVDIVRWARQALVARVVHDRGWEAGVRAALA
jgi:hypothetical protein